MRRARTAAGIAGLLGLSAYTALRSGMGVDYPKDAQPAIDALARGDLNAFFAHVPAMGPLSLLVRAPIAALGGADLTVYRLGALVCVLAAALAAAAIARAAVARTGQTPLAAAIVVALAAAGPMTVNALTWGHPEELLGAALCVAAVAIASKDRPLAAGIALGLALATKQWAVVAIAPVLVVAPRKRLALAGVAILLAGALYLPSVLANTGAVTSQTKNAAHTYDQVRPLSVWFPAANETDREVSDGVGTTTVTSYSLPSSLGGLSHPAIVLLPIPLALLLIRRRRRKTDLETALAFLALVLLARCALDPVDNGYYHVPFLLALGAHEVLARRGLPLVSMLSATVLWLVVRKIPLDHVSAASAVYLAWAAATAATLGHRIYGPLKSRPAALPSTLAPQWPR
jgi:4-amino-4-deoxy-L-arabinose transferase-like glycosyltransferase